MIQELEDYLDTISIGIICDENFYNLVVKSGINFMGLPDTTTGTVDIAKKFLRESNYKIATDKHKDYYRAVFKFCEGLDLPQDQESLKERINELMGRDRIQLKAKKLVKMAESESLKDISSFLKDFDNVYHNDIRYGEITDLYNVYLTEHNELIKENKVLTKIKNFEYLSEMIGGFNESRIGLLMGESGLGKTNIGLSLALNARKTMSSAYVNLEMDFLDISRRATVLETGMKYKDFFKYEFPVKEMVSGLQKVNVKKLFMTDGKKLKIEQIKSWLRKLNKEHDLKFVVIDYDQKIEIQSSREEKEWKTIQRVVEDLEEFSKEIKSYIMVITQLNRDGQISSSFRAQFAAHNILKLHEDEELGYLIEATKNRHGKKGQAVKVFYDQSNSSIKEDEIIDLKEKRSKKRKML